MENGERWWHRFHYEDWVAREGLELIRGHITAPTCDAAHPAAHSRSSSRAHAAARGARASIDFQDPETPMTYVIAEPCIGTKDNSCVEVCPVDCIHPTPDEPDYDAVEQLFIDPEECIDCDACVEACPVDAIFAEDQLPEEWQRFGQINAEYYSQSK